MVGQDPLLHAKTAKSNDNRKQYATFFLDEHYFGIEVEWVQEILKFQEMTPVPLSPDYISGLINLRGQIVTAINLKCRLYGEDAPLSRDSMNLIVRSDEDVVSLLVDDVGDVLTLDDQWMHPVPPTLDSMKVDLLSSVCQLEDHLLIILNVPRVLAA